MKDAVREAFLHAWLNYKKYAWGQDELKPISKTGGNWLGSAATILDSLDTLWIMNLTEEFDDCRKFVAEELDFTKTRGDMSNFETTIRALGGLLSAYDLSHDHVFLQKAEQLGDLMIKAMWSGGETQIWPFATVNLRTGRGMNPTWTGGNVILSEVATLQLEFFYLAMKTGRPEFAAKILDVIVHLDQMQKEDGLYPVHISPRTNKFSGSQVTLGALGDSFYEYLLKMWLITNKQAVGYKRMYDTAVTAAMNHLLIKSTPSNFTYIAERQGKMLIHKMDHLVCFAGGMLALGAQHSSSAERRSEFEAGAELTRTCHEMYYQQPSGISPEFVNFAPNRDFYVPQRAPHYLLRPEAVESFFYLWRLTHDHRYREWGWQAFISINNTCRVASGFSGIRDVRDTGDKVRYDDTQQSFFLAETLKYLYLLFCDDDAISLDRYVFNTEAHPLSIFTSNMNEWESELTVHFPTDVDGRGLARAVL